MCILGSYGRQKKDTKIEFEKREREAKQKPFLEDKRKRAEETNRQKQEEKLKKVQEMEMKRQQADIHEPFCGPKYKWKINCWIASAFSSLLVFYWNQSHFAITSTWSTNPVSLSQPQLLFIIDFLSNTKLLQINIIVCLS